MIQESLRIRRRWYERRIHVESATDFGHRAELLYRWWIFQEVVWRVVRRLTSQCVCKSNVDHSVFATTAFLTFHIIEIGSSPRRSYISFCLVGSTVLIASPRASYTASPTKASVVCVTPIPTGIQVLAIVLSFG